MASHGLPKRDATVLAEDAAFGDFFDEAVAIAGAQRARQLANWMLGDLAAHLNATGGSLAETQVTPAMLAELVELVESGAISGKQAKEVFSEMAGTGDAPGAIVELRGMRQVSDVDAIDAAVSAVLEAYPDKVEQYRAGKTGLMGFFVGQVMRGMGGQGNPALVNERLSRRLNA